MSRFAFKLLARLAASVALAGVFWLASAPLELSASAQSAARRKAPPIGRCINVAGALEADREGDWGYIVRDKDLRLIAETGFEAIRLPVKWSAHAKKDLPYTIDPKFLARVDHIINTANAYGLRVILDMHHYDELYANPDAHEARFVAMWIQLARHYKDYPNDKLIFELINEPRDKFVKQRMSDAQNRLLGMVRQSNPTRTVILSGDSWGNFEGVDNLRIPPDPNIMVSVHFYEPFEFTHQGAKWMEKPPPLGPDWGKVREIKKLAAYAEEIAKWQEAKNAPIFLGEFGAASISPRPSRSTTNGASAGVHCSSMR
jgi:endoglucanase